MNYHAFKTKFKQKHRFTVGIRCQYIFNEKADVKMSQNIWVTNFNAIKKNISYAILPKVCLQIGIDIMLLVKLKESRGFIFKKMRYGMK